MDRRTFLKTTGGIAAGAALSPAFLRAASSPIRHIVVVMMENRSFDHFPGWLPNADGKQSGLSFTDANGASHPTHELAPDWTGCGFNDPDHSYAGRRIEVNNGLMDGFMTTSSADEYAIGYYQEAENQFLSQFVRNFTTCDSRIRGKAARRARDAFAHQPGEFATGCTVAPLAATGGTADAVRQLHRTVAPQRRRA